MGATVGHKSWHFDWFCPPCLPAFCLICQYDLFAHARCDTPKLLQRRKLRKTAETRSIGAAKDEEQHADNSREIFGGKICDTKLKLPESITSTTVSRCHTLEIPPTAYDLHIRVRCSGGEIKTPIPSEIDNSYDLCAKIERKLRPT